MIHRILHVEDEEDDHLFLKDVVDHLLDLPPGHRAQVVWAKDLREGESRIDEGNWSLIVLDIYLQEPSDHPVPGDVKAGMELVRRAAAVQQDGNTRTPIIVLTQFSLQQRLRTEAMQAGVSKVLAKRIESDVLKREIEASLDLNASVGSLFKNQRISLQTVQKSLKEYLSKRHPQGSIVSSFCKNS